MLLGMSEIGPMSRALSPLKTDLAKDWNWFEFDPSLPIRLDKQEALVDGHTDIPDSPAYALTVMVRS